MMVRLISIRGVIGAPLRVTCEVAVTVVHEVAHHFGIPEHRLHELGWG